MTHRSRWWRHGLLAWLLAAAVVRLASFFVFPDFTTQDSSEYFVLAQQFADGGGLDHPRIGNWRAPGYIVFLGLEKLLCGADTLSLMAIQGALGLATVAAGWALGTQLAGRRGACALATYFALHPVYLLFEHTVHAETLGLALLIAGTALAVTSFGRRSVLLAALAGSILGVAALTRPNVAPWIGVLGVGLALVPWRRSESATYRFARRWLLAFGVGVLALLGPWLWRQYQTFGQIGIILNLHRSQLIYLAQHQEFDWSGVPPDDSIFDFVADLGDAPQPAEARAREVFARQIAGKEERLWLKRLRATATFAGIPNYDPPAPGRHDVRFWLQHFVRRPGGLNLLRHDLRLPKYYLRNRLAPRHANLANDAWALVGDLTLRFGRPLLLLCALALAVHRVLRRQEFSSAEWIVASLLVAHFAVATVHGWYLADYDRFAVLFDWVPVAVVVTLLPRVPCRTPAA